MRVRHGQTAAAVAALLVVLVACASDTDRTTTRAERDSELVSAIQRQLDLRPGHENVRALLADVDGEQVVAQYDDVPASRHWDVGWETTAFVTTLVGIAIDEGHIPGVSATLAELLPDHTDDMSPAVARVTLREVLTMTGGFATARGDATGGQMSAPDPVGAILRAARPTPARSFHYSSQGAHVLGAVVAEATGSSLLDYARSRLLDPLGIDTDETGFGWATDARGLHQGWTSLTLRPSDVAKLGQLYLDHGRWDGQQVVSAAWVREATKVQEDNVSRPDDNLSGYGGYGYGWWLIESDNTPAYFVADLTGQLLEVLPAHALVVVVASEAVEGSPGMTPDALTFLVSDVIGPAARSERRSS